jgi:hypothetical protein
MLPHYVTISVDLIRWCLGAITNATSGDVKDLTAEAQRKPRKKELILFMESILCDLGVLRPLR